jgi:hypothetical protein
MEGQQMLEPGRMTTGVLSVRPTEVNNQRFLRAMTDALANGAHFYLSEMSTPRHPIYVDFDLTLNVRDYDQMRLMIDIIKAAAVKSVSGSLLDDSLLFNKQTLADGRVIQYLNFPKRDILNHHASLLHHLETLYPQGSYSWIQVFDALLNFDVSASSAGASNSAFGTEGMLYSRLDQPLISVLATHLILAVGKLAQQSIARFFPSLVDDSRLELAVLGSYQGDRCVPWTPRYDIVDGKVKIGAHLHMRGLKVDHASDLLLHEGLVQHFMRLFGRRGADEPYWRQVFDVAVYRENCGGLRMPFSLKMNMCSCKPRGRHCAKCNHTGRISVDRYYGPVGSFLASGLLDDTEKTLDRWFKNILYVLMLCSLRISPDQRLTPGFTKPADVPEPMALDLRRQDFKDRFGAVQLKKLESKRLPNDEMFSDEQLTHELEAKISMLDSSLKLPTERTEILLPNVAGDGRFETVAQWLPSMASRVMDPQYINLQIASVILVRACKDGEPETLYVYVRGAAANLCHNRTSAPTASGGLQETYWNTHNGWRNTIYFCIHRVGLTLIQKCSNMNERETRRNKDPVSQMGCCKKWEGEFRKLDAVSIGQPMDDDGMRHFKAILRNMFYKRTEQSEAQTMAVLAAQAKRLQQMYRKRAFSELDIVGNDDQYESLLRDRLLDKQPRRAAGPSS